MGAKIPFSDSEKMAIFERDWLCDRVSQINKEAADAIEKR